MFILLFRTFSIAKRFDQHSTVYLTNRAQPLFPYENLSKNENESMISINHVNMIVKGLEMSGYICYRIHKDIKNRVPNNSSEV